MYDRRPASRAARGTPTVAAVTPPNLSVLLRGSCQLAMSSPLARAKGPFATADISWMPEGTSSETAQRLAGAPWSESLLNAQEDGAAVAKAGPATLQIGRAACGITDVRKIGKVAPEVGGLAS